MVKQVAVGTDRDPERRKIPARGGQDQHGDAARNAGQAMGVDVEALKFKRV
jgi:hypothetical protein